MALRKMSAYSHPPFLPSEDRHLDPQDESTDYVDGEDYYVCEYCEEKVFFDSVSAKHIDTGLCEDCFADQYE